MCPPEVSQEDYDRLLKMKERQEKSYQTSKAYRDKRNKAVKALIADHKDEYDKMMA